MRRMVWVIGPALVVGLILGGCYYKRPNIEAWYGQIREGSTQAEVVKILGQPTRTEGHELFYIYDDPEHPVRLRFVLDDDGVVVEKYYETKESLAKQAAEKQGQPPTVNPTAPGEENATYPGGPLQRFSKPLEGP